MATHVVGREAARPHRSNITAWREAATRGTRRSVAGTAVKARVFVVDDIPVMETSTYVKGRSEENLRGERVDNGRGAQNLRFEPCSRHDGGRASERSSLGLQLSQQQPLT